MSSGIDTDKPQDPGRGYHGPRPGSLRQQLRDWFQANPGEALTFDDIAAKFDVTRSAACSAVDTLKAEGLLRTSVMVSLDTERGR